MNYLKRRKAATLLISTLTILLSSSYASAASIEERNEQNNVRRREIVYPFLTETSKSIEAVSDSVGSSTGTKVKIASGITVSRKVEQLPSSATIKIDFEPSSICKSHDKHGGNSCHFNWNEKFVSDVSGDMGVDLKEGYTISGHFKIDTLVHWNFECNVCGQDCQMTLPVTNEEVTLKMKPCPIQGNSLANSMEQSLPDKFPLGIGINMYGKIHLKDDKGMELARVKLALHAD